MNPSEKIILLMREKNITRKELSEKSGVSLRALYNLIKNYNRSSYATKSKIADTLNISIDELNYVSDTIPADKTALYEYKTLVFLDPEGIRRKSTGHINMSYDKTLNEYALQGWEISYMDYDRFLLKRKITK